MEMRKKRGAKLQQNMVAKWAANWAKLGPR